MTAFYDAAGNRITKAAFPSTAVPDPLLRQVTSAVYKREQYNSPGGEANPDGGKFVLAFIPGDRLSQAELDAHYPAATITNINPATGPQAGGTVITITGTNLTGVSGVTFGGTAGTAVTVLSATQIRVTTPAKAAGALNVVVADDAGNVTSANGYTYV